MRQLPDEQTPAPDYPNGCADLADLVATLDPAIPVFVLIDPMLGEPIPAADSRADWHRDVVPVTLHPSVTLPPHQHPYLVALEGIDDPLLETTLEIAHGERTVRLSLGLKGHGGAAHRVGGWLQSSMHSDQLAGQLSAMFRVKTDARTSATYLRLIDRRVLGLLRHLIGDERLGGQFGRLQSWTYLGPLGRLATLRSRTEEVTPIRLSEAEWVYMGQGDAIHRTIKQLLGELGSAPVGAHLQEPQLYTRAGNALDEASRIADQWPQRFKQLQDKTTWAVLSMLFPDLANAEPIQRLLQEQGTTGSPPDPLMYAYPEICELALEYVAARRQISH